MQKWSSMFWWGGVVVCSGVIFKYTIIHPIMKISNMILRYCNTASTKKRYNDTAIQEPGTGTKTAHNLCKLSHFITAGDISDNIFQGGIFSRES